MARKRSFRLGALIESFFNERLVQQRSASPATISAYKDALRLLLVFAASRLGKHVDYLGINDLDYQMVLDFLDFLERERGNSIRTRNARLAAVHSFFRHVAYSDPAAIALAQRILSIDPKRTIKRVVQFLQPPEVDALLAAPRRSTKQGRRDHALLLFFLRTGVRASEAVGVNAADLMLVPPYQVRIRGKGSKERVLPLAQDLVAVIRALLEERRLDDRQVAPIFTDPRGNRLSRFGVVHIVRRAATTAARTCPTLRTRSVSPHSFRHTAAMRLLQARVDLAVIRGWLGHQSIQTTHDYLEADLEMKRQALAAISLNSELPALYQAPSTILALLEG
jgi:integrase/recombinase XerD